MPFQKGHKYYGGKKGRLSANKDFKEYSRHLVNKYCKKIETWINIVGEDNPKEAVKLLIELAEFNYSKMARLEMAETTKYPISFTFTPAQKKPTKDEINKAVIKN